MNKNVSVDCEGLFQNSVTWMEGSWRFEHLPFTLLEWLLRWRKLRWKAPLHSFLASDPKSTVTLWTRLLCNELVNEPAVDDEPCCCINWCGVICWPSANTKAAGQSPANSRSRLSALKCRSARISRAFKPASCQLNNANFEESLLAIVFESSTTIDNREALRTELDRLSNCLLP